ncbi:GGDEF domain-containing protein [uncultured Cetobacterium sp.]|uniref:GGDEF domain-containing protein n=1 Tax=uncultured Cetobacterium sp. TaxID=527638 RepID=UPI00262F0FCE|nr:GGDEF domain-containing protein [uncultured Cetobacterium sp.]
MIFKLIYPLLIVLFFISTFINKNNLFSDINSSVDNFNIRFNKDIQILKNEIDFLYVTKKSLPFVNYTIDDNITYFNIEGNGVYFKNITSYPDHFNFYNLKEAKENLNSKFDNSLLFIVYNSVESFANKRQIVYSNNFSKVWVDTLKNGSLISNSFKNKRSISRDNTEFSLYNLYTDRIYNKEMFTIIFPEYDYFNNSQRLKALWYFDFNSNFFAKNTIMLKNTLDLDVSIIDGDYKTVYSTNGTKINSVTDINNFYVFPLEKTNYKILVEKENMFQLIKAKEIFLIFFIFFLVFYINKKDKLKKELHSLKMINKIKSELLLREPLTSLYNRYFLQEEMVFPINNCGVVLLDIDHFKNINDTFGHDKGDHVLKAVSNCIKLVSIGSADAFRWGGEEFLIIFKDTDKETLLAKVNTLQNLIRNLNIVDNYKITASFGVIYTNIKDKSSFYSAVSKADKNLYTAKKTGRDKVVAF